MFMQRLRVEAVVVLRVGAETFAEIASLGWQHVQRILNRRSVESLLATRKSLSAFFHNAYAAHDSRICAGPQQNTVPIAHHEDHIQLDLVVLMVGDETF